MIKAISTGEISYESLTEKEYVLTHLFGDIGTKMLAMLIVGTGKESLKLMMPVAGIAIASVSSLFSLCMSEQQTEETVTTDRHLALSSSE